MAAERETSGCWPGCARSRLDLPFDGRLDAFVDQRCRLLEWMTPVCRAAALHGPTSATLQAARHQATSAGDHELTRVFAPEIAQLPDETRQATVDALCALTSWAAWDDLRTRGRSQEASRDAVRHALQAMLAPTS